LLHRHAAIALSPCSNCFVAMQQSALLVAQTDAGHYAGHSLLSGCLLQYKARADEKLRARYVKTS
jgi:hypothetical protein